MRCTFSSRAFATIDFLGFDPSHLTNLLYTFSWRSHLTTVYTDPTWAPPSTYLDVIDSHPDWLGALFVEEAEYLRDTNERVCRWEYLGEITGTGGVIFDNVHEAKLSDSRIRTFQRIRNGMDWGWLLCDEACLVMATLFIPLVPVLKAFECGKRAAKGQLSNAARWSVPPS